MAPTHANPEKQKQENQDFLGRFSNNNDEHLKKEMYKKELDHQRDQKRQESVEKQKREQIAGDVWSNLFKGKSQLSQPPSQPPSYVTPPSSIESQYYPVDNTQER